MLRFGLSLLGSSTEEEGIRKGQDTDGWCEG